MILPTPVLMAPAAAAANRSNVAFTESEETEEEVAQDQVLLAEPPDRSY
jgi:hypothetical protein